MSIPLAERAQINIAPPHLADQPFENEGGTFKRILALAALARQVDPSVPTYLRAHRVVPYGEPAHSVPFSLVFSNDGRERLPHGVEEDASVEKFWDVIERVLPGESASLKRSLEIRSENNPFDAAMREAVRQEGVGFQEVPGEPGGYDKFYSAPIAIEQEALLDYPDLTDYAFRAPLSEQAPSTPFNRLVRSYQGACATLSKDLEQTNAFEREKLLQDLKHLDRAEFDGSFEENHKHGWIGYALAQGAKGWTRFLTQQAGLSPHTPYGEYSPITLAVALNEGPATRELLEAGVSPNTVLRGWPKFFVGRGASAIEKKQDTFLPLLVMGSGMGATASVSALLAHGADPAVATEKKQTALHEACEGGHEATARQLAHYQADFTRTNAAGQTPAQVIVPLPRNKTFAEWASAQTGEEPSAHNPAQGLAGRMGQAVEQGRKAPNDFLRRPSQRRNPNA